MPEPARTEMAATTSGGDDDDERSDGMEIADRLRWAPPFAFVERDVSTPGLAGHALLALQNDNDRLREQLAEARSAVARVRALCEGLQVEAVDGGRADADTLWPAHVLAALDGDGDA